MKPFFSFSGFLVLCANLVGCTSGPNPVVETRMPALPAMTAVAVGNTTPLPANPAALESYHAAVKAVVNWYDGLPAERRAEECERAGLVVEKDETTETGLLRFELAEKYQTRLLEFRHTRPGVGVPVVAWRPNDGSGRFDSLRPPEGVAAAMTAVLLPLPDGRRKLRFVNVEKHDTVVLHGRRMTVAADFTAPVAQLVERARPLARSGLGGMLSYSGSQRREKLYLIQPYDPRKIPLLMVHGLQSTPVAFANLTNDLIADPLVRQRYQIWHYHYPTGTPVLQNAAKFREVLQQTLLLTDPEGRDFATRNLVVIGHSMGGIITHTLVSDSGHALWDAVIKVRPGSLKMPVESRKLLEPVFVFKQDPRVRRVIFVAVPHRGSNWADNFIGDLGQTLFRPERRVQSVFADLIQHHPEQVHEFIVALHRQGKISSIRTLSARSPALMALSRIPPAVPFHSIIGQKSPGPPESGSDGIVAYQSSHLEGAESELIVRSGHNAFRKPEAVAEIKRILYEHVKTGTSAGLIRPKPAPGT